MKQIMFIPKGWVVFYFRISKSTSLYKYTFCESLLIQRKRKNISIGHVRKAAVFPDSLHIYVPAVLKMQQMHFQIIGKQKNIYIIRYNICITIFNYCIQIRASCCSIYSCQYNIFSYLLDSRHESNYQVLKSMLAHQKEKTQRQSHKMTRILLEESIPLGHHYEEQPLSQQSQ